MRTDKCDRSPAVDAIWPCVMCLPKSWNLDGKRIGWISKCIMMICCRYEKSVVKEMGVEIGTGTGVVIVRTGAMERYEPGDSVDTTGSLVSADWDVPCVKVGEIEPQAALLMFSLIQLSLERMM